LEKIVFLTNRFHLAKYSHENQNDADDSGSANKEATDDEKDTSSNSDLVMVSKKQWEEMVQKLSTVDTLLESINLLKRKLNQEDEDVNKKRKTDD